MAGRVYHARDYVEGATAPPFHPNCGCSVREWGREEELSEIGELSLSMRCAEMMISWEGSFFSSPTHVIVNGKREPYPTIGYGHYMMDEINAGKRTVTIDGIEYSILTEELAIRLFWQDVNNKFAPKLNDFLGKNDISLNQTQYDAVLMHMYQQGQNILDDDKDTPLKRYLLNGDFTDYDACLEAFLMTTDWEITEVPGLRQRRTDEANLFFHGTYNNN